MDRVLRSVGVRRPPLVRDLISDPGAFAEKATQCQLFQRSRHSFEERPKPFFSQDLSLRALTWPEIRATFSLNSVRSPSPNSARW